MAKHILKITAAKQEIIQALESLRVGDELYYTDKHGNRIRGTKWENGLIDWRRAPHYMSGAAMTAEDIAKYYL